MTHHSSPTAALTTSYQITNPTNLADLRGINLYGASLIFNGDVYLESSVDAAFDGAVIHVNGRIHISDRVELESSKFDQKISGRTNNVKSSVPGPPKKEKVNREALHGKGEDIQGLISG